jgi:Protein of unknown function (DUF1565)
MASYKNINTNYTLTVGTDANGVYDGSGTFTINANTIFQGNTVFVVPAVQTSPFITVAANNTGSITDMGLLAQVGPNSFSGFRFDTFANTWQISSSVYANGAPIAAYANIQTPPGGANTQIQFNNDNEFGGSANLTFDYATSLLTLTGNASISGNISAGNIVGNVSFTTSANILYVGTNGNDGNPGTLQSPFLTIAQAMTQAQALGGNVSVHVAPGTYVENMPITIPPNTALMGDNLRNVFVRPAVASSDMFYMTSGSYVWGITVRSYTGNAFSYNPATPTQNVYVSPYIQNLTSSTTTGTAVYIDGALSSSISTKAMIVGFFTIINRGGYGIHLKNSAYSQLVNIYTIACDIGIQVESGAFCTLNGSDCSIGNYGLVADGKGPLQTSGTIVNGYQGTFVIDNLSNGQPHVNTVILIDGDPQYYTIDTIVPNFPGVGNSTVAIQQTYLGNAGPGTTMSFYTRSSIIASAHTFEYVGAGTNPATALPQFGGIPIEANEVVATNGAVVTYTSTDQKGNFKVGSGFIVNQATATITGDAFYKSLFAQMTPYILALSGD